MTTIHTHTNHLGTYELTLSALNLGDGLRKATVLYLLRRDGGPAIFSGSEFHPSPMIHDAEGPESAEALLAFLTLKPGDTDREYFANYTPEQLAFAHDEADALYEWLCELNPKEHQ